MIRKNDALRYDSEERAHKLRLCIDRPNFKSAMFLGLQGVCEKSRGGADRKGSYNAIGLAFDLVDYKSDDFIRDEPARHYGEAELDDASGEKR